MVYEVTDLANRHPARELARRDLEESTNYVHDNMRDALGLQMRQDILEYALSQLDGEGHYLEFGVFKGDSIRFLAKNCGGKTIHGFDSFEGLPSDWSGFRVKKERFDLSGRLPKVPENVELHPGWFSDTIPVWKNKHSGPISFLHIDCDIYSSTKDIFDLLKDRITKGTIIVFDEYFNYPNWQQHEYRAFQEYVSANNIEYEYLAYAYEQVAVKILNG
jgi:predicted O-methyltransferase YrrM